jgi:tetratricopeptide (TPR) repeat protein
VRSIIEAFAKNQQMQQMLAKQQVQAGGGTGAKASGKGGKSAETTKEAKEVKKAIKQGSEAFDKKEYYEAIQAFTKALDMNPSLKWRKWLYKNRCSVASRRCLRVHTILTQRRSGAGLSATSTRSSGRRWQEMPSSHAPLSPPCQRTSFGVPWR